MPGRIMQLVARAIALAGLAIVGFVLGDAPIPDETVEIVNDDSMAIAAGVVSIAGLAVDMFIHKLGAGGLLKPAGGGQ